MRAATLLCGRLEVTECPRQTFCSKRIFECYAPDHGSVCNRFYGYSLVEDFQGSGLLDLKLYLHTEFPSLRGHGRTMKRVVFLCVCLLGAIRGRADAHGPAFGYSTSYFGGREQ